MRHHAHGHMSAMVLAALALTLASALTFTTALPSDAASSRRPTLSISTTSTPAADIVLDDTSSVHVATFTFRAGREAVVVDTLTLHNCVATQDIDGDCADARETAGDDEAVSLVTLAYTDSSGGSVTSTGVLSSGTVTFTGEDIYVGARSTASVEVAVDTAAIDDLAVFSGMQFQLNLNAKAETFNAVGQTSNRALTESSMRKNAIAGTMTLRDTRPTIVLSSSSPSGAGIPGVDEVLRTNIAADAGGDVAVRGIMFALSATDNNATDWNACSDLDDSALWTLENRTTGSALAPSWTFYTVSGNQCDTAPTNDLVYAYARFTETVPAGSTYTYALSLDTTGASASADDSIALTIPAQSTLSALSRAFRAFNWSDGTTTGGNINGTLLESLPVAGGTITY